MSNVPKQLIVTLLQSFDQLNFETFSTSRLHTMKAIGTIVVMLLQASASFLKSVSISTQQKMCLYVTKKSTRSSDSDANEKCIVFIRHGCTYMNEYLGRGHEFGSPHFSDVFSSPEDLEKYRDSKLSPLGVTQAKGLARRLAKTMEVSGKHQQQRLTTWNPFERKTDDNLFLPSDLDLVVVSPLTRALQTFDLGLKPVLIDPKPIVIALPLASERLYLVSDQGRLRSDLKTDWGNAIDFESGFRFRNKVIEEWWFGLDDQRDSGAAMPTGITSKSYKEWRPTSQNQKYACPGEDDESFENRMRKLYRWLGDRPESMIAIVCHWGVIDWFLDRDFMNCEVGVVPYNEIRPPSMMNEDIKEWSRAV